MKIDREINVSDLRQNLEKKKFNLSILILLVQKDYRIKNGVTNNIYKFNFLKVNLNIFGGALVGYPLQKIEKLLFLI